MRHFSKAVGVDSVYWVAVVGAACRVAGAGAAR